MPCPECSHTLAATCVNQLCNDSTEVCYHCPRCGTAVIKSAKEPRRIIAVYVPKLVERCREFAQKMNLGPLSNSLAVDEWRRLGIAESIHRPEDRPQGDPK